MIKKIIKKAIKNVNEDLQIFELDAVDEQTPLFELLDSLGTLDLILELEAIIEEEIGSYIAIADENSMSEEKTPFKNIIILEVYIKQRLEDA